MSDYSAGHHRMASMAESWFWFVRHFGWFVECNSILLFTSHIRMNGVTISSVYQQFCSPACSWWKHSRDLLSNLIKHVTIILKRVKERKTPNRQPTQKYFNKKRNNTVKSTKFHSFDFMWQCSCFHVTWHRHWCYSILSIVPFDGHLLQQHINTLSYGEISAEERESAYFFSNFP